MSALPVTSLVPSGLAGPGMRRGGVAGPKPAPPPCGPLPARSGPRAGIVHDLDFAAYLDGPELSKTRLWACYTRSPAHALIERETSNAMALGAAAHCAILEPAAFETRYCRGPEDRRGKRWLELRAEHGEALLTSGDYDLALRLRDAAMTNLDLRAILAGDLQTEVSAFWGDEESGLACRARADAWRPDHGLLIELKTTADASAGAFARRCAELGYHAGEAFYSDGFAACGQAIEGFVFAAIETNPPFAIALYELPPAAIAEGRAAMRLALERFSQCQEARDWPAYPSGVRALALPRWAYRLTDPHTEESPS